MIKIIKNTMTEPTEVTCPVCKSIFSYTYEDIQRRYNNTLVFGESFIRYLVCPVCKSDIDLSARVTLKDGAFKSEVKDD